MEVCERPITLVSCPCLTICDLLRSGSSIVAHNNKEITSLQDAIPSKPIYTVPEFCLQHRISRSLFYKLVKEGHGPRLMKAGKRTLVTSEAAEAWRRSSEMSSL
jgi:predicted DNA-binding transcriptional regulator AlpA